MTAEDVAVYTGLYLGLAQPADRTISRWEEMFLPMKLREHLAGMTVRRPDGREIPLVASERLLVPTTRPPEGDAPPERLLGYLLVGTILGAAFLLLAALAPRSRIARASFAGLSAVWTLFLGSGGLILIGLWVLTDHEIAYQNENVLQFSALALALMPLAPALVLGVRGAGRPAEWIAWVVVGLSALGFLLQASPGFDQVNGPVIALALPALLGLALALHRLRSARRYPRRGIVDTAVPHPPPAEATKCHRG